MKYTVLLLYPDYCGDGPEGTETYLAHIEIPFKSVRVAEERAIKEAAKANDIEPEQAEDFRVLFVCEDFQNDIKS